MMNKTQRWLLLPLLAGLASALGACASAPPMDTVSAAETALNKAIDAQAAEHAPLALRVAQEKLDLAKSSIYDGEYDKARRFAEEAQVDAQLAEAKARSVSANQHERQVKQTIDTLEDEADRESRSTSAFDHSH